LVVLEEIVSTLPTVAELKKGVRIRPHDRFIENLKVIGVQDDLVTQFLFEPPNSWFNAIEPDDPASTQEVLRSLGTALIAYLGAEARFTLTRNCPSFDPRSDDPSNALQSLLVAGTEVRDQLRDAFQAAFKTDIALDWGGMVRLYLRVSQDFGDIPESRVELDKKMEGAAELEKQGDGFRSFAGVALALLTYPDRVLLLDEPEAFLHPAQARALGRWVGSQAATRSGQIIVATHSADFLAGLSSSGGDTTILRLNRTDTITSFHRVPSTITAQLIESPLLSSQPVLDSLFHKGVVICEGDPDRSVYQMVAQRFHPGRQAEDFLFIHSNGKDAAKSPAALLRESGTPVCVIADFDILNSAGTLDGVVNGLTGNDLASASKVLRSEISAAIEVKSQEQTLRELKGNVANWLDQPDADLRAARRALSSMARAGANKWDRAKKFGLAALEGDGNGQARELLERLANLGLFVVPCGELESWMKLQRPKGNRWNQSALKELHSGNCPEELKEFVSQVLGFLERPRIFN